MNLKVIERNEGDKKGKRSIGKKLADNLYSHWSTEEQQQLTQVIRKHMI